METFPGMAAAALLCAASAVAAAPSGAPPAEALAAWPDAFVPGKVAVVQRHGKPHYAFAGEAEDLFPGEGHETEAELHEEAVLDAKAHFIKVLSKGNPSCAVAMSGMFVAYHWAEGPMRYVVCMVPVSAVSVTDKPPPEEIKGDAPSSLPELAPLPATPRNPMSSTNATIPVLETLESRGHAFKPQTVFPQEPISPVGTDEPFPLRLLPPITPPPLQTGAAQPTNKATPTGQEQP